MKTNTLKLAVAALLVSGLQVQATVGDLAMAAYNKVTAPVDKAVALAGKALKGFANLKYVTAASDYVVSKTPEFVGTMTETVSEKISEKISEETRAKFASAGTVVVKTVRPVAKLAVTAVAVYGLVKTTKAVYNKFVNKEEQA